ncbi:hypothetical protein P4U97_21750 [Bacillus swezeyi]|uniref:hypothetical protein n=1 Tax=Bacillus swezeyi TaxID=1925020 RepID=UPI002E1FC83C|nr:hypothetical protein [Bacillus swezeyi]
MADKRESIGKIKIDLDVSEALTGLKAIQREAKAATKAMAELREEQNNLSIEGAARVLEKFLESPDVDTLKLKDALGILTPTEMTSQSPDLVWEDIRDVYYGRIESAIEYVVIVVDTPGQAQMLESALRSLNSDRTRFQALHVGQAAVGWQFKGTRPTMIILAYSELKTDQEKKWEREVVNNLGYRNDHPTRQTKWISLLK